MLRASKERNVGWRNKTQTKGGCPGNEDVCWGTDGVIREQVSRDGTQAAACVSWRRCSSRVRACLRPQVLPRCRLLSRSGVGAQATCVDGLTHCALFENPPLQSELGWISVLFPHVRTAGLGPSTHTCCHSLSCSRGRGCSDSPSQPGSGEGLAVQPGGCRAQGKVCPLPVTFSAACSEQAGEETSWGSITSEWGAGTTAVPVPACGIAGCTPRVLTPSLWACLELPSPDFSVYGRNKPVPCWRLYSGVQPKRFHTPQSCRELGAVRTCHCCHWPVTFSCVGSASDGAADGCLSLCTPELCALSGWIHMFSLWGVFLY